MDSVLSRMLSDELTLGTTNKEFAKSLADALGLQGGFALGEYTRTVEIALRALQLEQGARVLLSPLAPAVYPAVLNTLGLRPYYVDVSEGAPVLDAGPLVEAATAGGISAVVLDAVEDHVITELHRQVTGRAAAGARLLAFVWHDVRLSRRQVAGRAWGVQDTA